MKDNEAMATIVMPKQLWHEFLVYTRINDTSASKRIRNYIRRTLKKPESEMEK